MEGKGSEISALWDFMDVFACVCTQGSASMCMSHDGGAGAEGLHLPMNTDIF